MLPSFASLAVLVAEAAPSRNPLIDALPLVLMFAVVYFVLLRPMSKQDKERRKRVAGLKKGDNVVIGGGILGRLSNVDDPKVAVVEIADKVKIRVLKKDLVDAAEAAIKEAPDAKAKPASDSAKDSDKPAEVSAKSDG